MSLCPLLPSTVCQYLTLYRLLVLCHCVHSCLLQSLHCLSVPHTVPSVGSVSLCRLLPSKVCPLSVSTSHCTVCWFCVTVSTTALCSLSIVCQYLTLYRLLVLCHYVHCCVLKSVHCLSVPHTAPSVGAVSLCPLLPSKVCPLSVSTSHCTVCWFSVTMSTTVFYFLPTICQYLTLHRLLVLSHYVHYCLLQSTHCLSEPHNVPSVGSLSLCPLLPSKVCPLSVPHTVQSVGSVSLCPLLSSTVYPLSVSTSHCTVCWFCVTMSTAVFYFLPTVSTSHCTVCWFCVTMSTTVFYSLPTVCQYLTLYSLLVLCHYVHYCLLQSTHCLSEPHSGICFAHLCFYVSYITVSSAGG